MKKLLLFLLCSIACMFMYACTSDDINGNEPEPNLDGDSIKIVSFLQEFHSNVRFFSVNEALDINRFKIYGDVWNTRFFDVAVGSGYKTGFSLKVASSDVCDSLSNKDKWYQLKEKYADTSSFADYFTNWDRKVINDSIKSIDIIALDDFNKQHPKGSSLSDIAYFCYLTPYFAITLKCNYNGWSKCEYITTTDWEKGNCYYKSDERYLALINLSSDMVCMPLSSITEYYTQLVDVQDIRFMFSEMPSSIGMHKLRVKVTFSGHTVEQDIDVDLPYLTTF